MHEIIKKEYCQTISNWVDKNVFTRFFFSPVSLALCYGIFLFAYEIQFLRDLIPAIHPVLIAWAGAIVAYNMLIRKKLMTLPGAWLLILFSAVCLVSVILNKQAGILGNVKAWILSVLPIFAFLPVCQMASGEQRKKVLLKVLLGASIVIFLASSISLVLYMMRFGGTLKLFGLEHHIGIRLYDPRYADSGVLLFGVYCDPNHAAMYAIAFAVYSLVLLQECRKGLFKARWQNLLGMLYAVLNLLVQICYFPLANSRGGWLCLVIACVIIFFLYFNNSSLRKGKLLRSIISFVLAVAITAGICGFFVGLRATMVSLSEVVVNSINAAPRTDPTVSQPTTTDPTVSQPTTTDPTVSQPTTTDPSVSEPLINNQLGEDVVLENFQKYNETLGAGRIELWTDALKLFAKRPIFGEAPGNNQYYAVLYGFENKIAEGKALHNSYLDLLVDYGLLGFAFLLCFWAVCLFIVLKRIASKQIKADFSYYAISMAVLMIAGVICFISCAFISTTAMYYIMLIMTGYLIAPQESSVETDNTH